MSENHFTIVIPSYNTEKWVKKCLGSSLKQEYDSYDIVYIDDASTDNTLAEVKKVIDSIDSRANIIKVVENDVNKKALSNIYNAVRGSQDNTIIVTLDGDDWIAGKNVLQKLDQVYDEEVWMTAGSYLDNYSMQVSSPNLSLNFWDSNIRLKQWTISHLRTFRKNLFLSIDKKDLYDRDGDFYKFTFDQAMMFPMAEMSGPKHFREVNEVVYIYNRENPLSVDRIHRSDQLRIERDIRNKETYKRLK